MLTRRLKQNAVLVKTNAKHRPHLRWCFLLRSFHFAVT